MSAIRTIYARVFAVSVATFLAAWPSEVGAQQLRIGPSDIGGVVTGANGPEAGVWVIAETTGLGTRRYAKIVVTDEQVRYLLPALPSGAQYNVWVRGFGLVDSRRVPAKAGMTLNLTATVAPNARAAAQYYPGSYWWSMLKIPEKGLFPGTGPKGNGMPTALKSQADWMDAIKQNGCGNCHQVGSSIMRSIDHAAFGVGEKDTQAAWMARLRMGQSGTAMVAGVNSLMTNDGGLLGRLANWTDRIAAGELPKQKPDRPQGIERNIVVTLWDWSRPTAYLHDLIGTDKRKPTVQPNGKFYGSAEESTDYVPILDPVTHTATEVKMPVRDAKTPSSKADPMAPSPYWGAEPIWDSQVSNHNPMMDEKGRVWFTSRVRPPANPDFCKKGSDHPSAKVFPLETANRHLSMYDPTTGKFTLISTCFPTHHLIFAEDANNTLWTSSGVGGAGVVGWLNRKLFEETGDEVKSQGWTPVILDTNG